MYASFLSKNANEREYVFISDNIDKAIEANGNSVDFMEIRKKRISSMTSMSKYYLRSENRTGLTKIVNEDLISILQKKDKKGQSDFDEDEFEKTRHLHE